MTNYSKMEDNEPIKKATNQNIEENADVIDLESTIPNPEPIKPSEQEKVQLASSPPLVNALPPPPPPQEAPEIASSTSSSKKYVKDSHALKLAYLNRAASSLCPSEGSQVSFRKRKKQEKKAGFLHTDLQSMRSGVSSSFSGGGGAHSRGEASKQSSFLNFRVKVEHCELSSLRKKVCRKIYEIILKDFLTDKKLAKRLTLELEKKINFFFNSSHSEKRYIGIIKSIFKLLKVSQSIIARKKRSLSMNYLQYV